MDLQTFMDNANRYRSEGDAILDQLQAVYDGEDMGDQSSNALSYAAAMLRDLDGVSGADSLASEIEQYLGVYA